VKVTIDLDEIFTDYDVSVSAVIRSEIEDQVRRYTRRIMKEELAKLDTHALKTAISAHFDTLITKIS
jgi:hypothetical protein